MEPLTPEALDEKTKKFIKHEEIQELRVHYQSLSQNYQAVTKELESLKVSFRHAQNQRHTFKMLVRRIVQQIDFLISTEKIVLNDATKIWLKEAKEKLS